MNPIKLWFISCHPNLQCNYIVIIKLILTIYIIRFFSEFNQKYRLFMIYWSQLKIFSNFTLVRGALTRGTIFLTRTLSSKCYPKNKNKPELQPPFASVVLSQRNPNPFGWTHIHQCTALFLTTNLDCNYIVIRKLFLTIYIIRISHKYFLVLTWTGSI